MNVSDSSRLPLDLLLLLVLLPTYTVTDNPYLVIVPLLVYLLLAIVNPLTQDHTVPDSGSGRWFFLARLALLWIIIVAVVVVPVLTNVYVRVTTPVDAADFSPAYADLHDGAVHTELALRYLDQGKNPYVERYEGTQLNFYSFSEVPADWSNPVFDHLPYLPGYLLYSFPFYELAQVLAVPYDQRLPYLLSYVLLLIVLPILFEAPTNKLAVIVGVGLNRLVVGPVIIGMNDIVLLLFIVLAVLALRRDRLFLSAILFGITCGIKQFSWLILPFYLLYVLSRLPERELVRNLALVVGLIGLAAVSILLPFFIWDPGAFFADVISFAGGSGANPYPITGYTLGNLLVGAGVIESRFSSFPFWIFQLVLGIPFLFGLLAYQRRQNRLDTMLLLSATFIFSFGFLSRYFQSNYVGLVTALAALGLFLRLNKNTAIEEQTAGQ